MNKLLATTLGSAALIGGAVFGAATLTGVAGAESTTDEPAAAPAGFVQVQDDSGAPEAPADGENCNGRHRGGRNLGAVAESIGISTEELRAAFADGQTIREVAEANGVDPQTVVDAVVADAEARIGEKVESGDLTQAEADEKLADGAERAESLLDRVPGERGPRGDRAGTATATA